MTNKTIVASLGIAALTGAIIWCALPSKRAEVSAVPMVAKRVSPVSSQKAASSSLISVSSTEKHFKEELPQEHGGLIRQITEELRRWKAEKDPAVRDKILAGLYASLSDDNSELLLRNLPPDLLDTPFATTAFNRWSERQPGPALQWLAGTPKPGGLQIQRAVGLLVTQDAGAAHQYIDALPEGDWKQRVLVAAVDSALSKDIPQDAIAWILQLAPEKRSPAQMDMALAKWAKTDVQAAVDWINQQTDPALQDRFLVNLAIGYTSVDPGAALKLALANLSPGDSLNRAAAGIFTQWADDTPSAAAQGLANVPEGDARKNAVGAVLTKWADYDPSGARNWVLSQPVGASRDQMVAQLGLIESQTDPAGAAGLVSAELPPGVLQNDTVNAVLTQWVQKDPQRATAWVQKFPAGPEKDSAMAILASAPAQRTTGDNR